MSNTTCRPHGIAKRALALLTAIALATALTPSFALAEEANNSASITAEQNPTADSASSPSTADSAANKGRRHARCQREPGIGLQQRRRARNNQQFKGKRGRIGRHQ